MPDTLESEIELFKQKLRERVRLDIPRYKRLYDRTMVCLESCRAHLKLLSDAGVPAWLILFPIWRLGLAKDIPRMFRRYKSPKTWNQLVRNAEKLAAQLKDSPRLNLPDAFNNERMGALTEQLMDALNEWAGVVKRSPFVDENHTIFGALTPDGWYYISSSGEVKKKVEGSVLHLRMKNLI